MLPFFTNYSSKSLLEPWTPTFYSVATFSPSSPATASFGLESNGTMFLSGSSITPLPPSPFVWYNGAPIVGIGNSFWVRVTSTSTTTGTLGGALIDTWLQLDTQRFWSLSTTFPGEPDTVSFSVFVNSAATNTGQTFMGNIELFAEVSV